MNKVPVYGLGSPDPVYYVNGGTDFKVYVDYAYLSIVCGISFHLTPWSDTLGAGTIMLADNPGDPKVKEFLSKQEHRIEVRAAHSADFIEIPFCGRIRLENIQFGIATDDIVIETRVNFTVLSIE